MIPRWRLRGGAILLAALIALELALSWAGPFMPGTYRTGPLIEAFPPLGWRHIPGSVTHFRGDGYQSSVRINAQGRQGRLITDVPAPGVRRVLLLGDGVLEEAHLPIERQISTLLEMAVVGVEIVNDGVSGYGTDQEVLLLEPELAAVRPAAVVLLFNVGNDVWNNARALDSRQPTKDKPYFDLDAAGRLTLAPLPVDVMAGERIRGLLARSSLLSALRSGIVDALLTGGQPREMVEALGVLREPSGEWVGAWAITEALLARVAELTAGLPLLLVVAPHKCQVQPDECGSQRSLAASRVPQLRLAAVASRLGIPLVDLLPGLRAAADGGVRVYLPGNLPWTERGNTLAAELIAPALTGLLAVPVRN